MHWYLLWGLGAAMAWGSADFFAKKAAVEFGFWPTVWGMNAVGALALSALWGAGGITIPRSQLLLLIGLGVGNTIGGVVFYYALEFGPLVLVSPITAAYPVVSAWLAYEISGERLGPLVALAVGGVILGTLLASVGAGEREIAHPRRVSALWAAAAGAVIFGAVFYALAAHAGASSSTAPVFVFRLAGASLLALPVLVGKRLPLSVFRSRWVWATGLLDSAAYLFYAEGAHHLPVSVVSALSGLFTVWTLVLAIVFLRERLLPRQWAGVLLILTAITLLSWR